MTDEEAINEMTDYDYYDDYDYCYECRGYGNDYYVDDNGDLVSACDDCFYYDWSDDE